MLSFWDALQAYRAEDPANTRIRQLSGKHRQAIEALQIRQPKHCRICLAPLSGRKTQWCGQGCVNAYFLICGYPGETQAAVRQRDEETCQLCGLDLKKLVDSVYDSVCEDFDRAARRLHNFVPRQHVHDAYTVRQASQLLSWLSSHTIYDIDHIHPVCLGGGCGYGTKESYGLSNLRLLCKPCHRHITSKLQRTLRTKK